MSDTEPGPLGGRDFAPIGSRQNVDACCTVKRKIVQALQEIGRLGWVKTVMYSAMRRIIAIGVGKARSRRCDDAVEQEEGM